jgi:hypothetical protein
LSKQILERLHFHISRIAASIEQGKNVAVWICYHIIIYFDLDHISFTNTVFYL